MRAVTGPSVWRGAECGGKDAISFSLSPRHLEALDENLKTDRSAGLHTESIERAAGRTRDPHHSRFSGR
jgi:hypothetical protein